MSGFKLLAIRPMEGTPRTILKNLIEGEIYQFYSDYRFNKTDPDNIVVTHESTISSELYNDQKPYINISAIVGRNGSGKSTLMDLFYAFCYSVSVFDRKITIREGSDTPEYSFFKEINIHRKIFCEVYYQIGNDSNDNIYRIKLNALEDGIVCEKLNVIRWDRTVFESSKFFYSIAINYSLYGLNSNYQYWYDALFHKNDGYQLPLVINPFRNDGNIDVNYELHLAQSRTLLNLSLVNEDNPKIINDKNIHSVRFEINIINNSTLKLPDIGVYRPWDALYQTYLTKHSRTLIDLFGHVLV